MYKLQEKTNEKYGTVHYVTIDNQDWYAIYDIANNLDMENPFYVFLEEIKTSDRKIIEYAESTGEIATLPVINETGVRVLLEDCEEYLAKHQQEELEEGE